MTIQSILEELAKHSVLAYLHAESATRAKTIEDAQISQEGAVEFATQKIEQFIDEEVIGKDKIQRAEASWDCACGEHHQMTLDFEEQNKLRKKQRSNLKEVLK
mgnify:CR=1 FL=1